MKRTLTRTFTRCLLAVSMLVFGHQAQAQDVAAEFIGSFQGQLEAVQSGGAYAPLGRIEFTVAKTGKTTGKIILLDKKAYPFATTLVADGDSEIKATVDVVKAKIGPSPLTLNLAVSKTGTFTAAGIPLSPVVPAGVGIYRAIAGSAVKVAVFAKTAPCEWAGTYSLAFFDPSLPLGSTDTRPFPTGASFASVTIASTGVMTVKGKLADGGAIIASVKPTTTAQYSFQISPYKSGGGFVTSFELTEAEDTYAVATTATNSYATWSKGAVAKDKIYPLGFGPLSLSVVLNKWTVPDAKTKQTLPQVLGTENFQFDFDLSGAGLDLVTKYFGTIPKKLTVNAKGELVPVYGDVFSPSDLKEWAKIWTGKVDPKTGIYTGTLTISDMVDPDGAANLVAIKFIKRKLTFSGILFNVDDVNVALAYGNFLLPPLDPKVDTIKAGSFEFGSLFETLGLGKPDTGSVPSGTAGNYTATVDQLVNFDYSQFPTAGVGGVGIKVTGSIKNVPADDSNIKFSIAPDFSFIVFNGRKVPLMGNAHPVQLFFSDATARNINNNTLTVTVYLNTSTGLVHGFGAFYTQRLPASITAFGHRVNAFVLGSAVYSNVNIPVKVP